MFLGDEKIHSPQWDFFFLIMGDCTPAPDSPNNREGPELKRVRYEPSSGVLQKDLVVYFDLESTGLNTRNVEIIEIAAMYSLGNGSMREFTSLVNNASGHIPYWASNINMIFRKDVESAPLFTDVGQAFVNWLAATETLEAGRGIVLAAHNCFKFDRPLLEAELHRHGLVLPANVRFADTLPAFRRLLPHLKKYGLEALSKSFVPEDMRPAQIHRALSDVKLLILTIEHCGVDLEAELIAQDNVETTTKTKSTHKTKAKPVRSEDSTSTTDTTTVDVQVKNTRQRKARSADGKQHRAINISNNNKNCTLRIRVTRNGIPYQRTWKYGVCGIDAAMTKANIFRDEILERCSIPPSLPEPLLPLPLPPSPTPPIVIVPHNMREVRFNCCDVAAAIGLSRYCAPEEIAKKILDEQFAPQDEKEEEENKEAVQPFVQSFVRD